MQKFLCAIGSKSIVSCSANFTHIYMEKNSPTLLHVPLLIWVAFANLFQLLLKSKTNCCFSISRVRSPAFHLYCYYDTPCVLHHQFHNSVIFNFALLMTFAALDNISGVSEHIRYPIKTMKVIKEITKSP